MQVSFIKKQHLEQKAEISSKTCISNAFIAYTSINGIAVKTLLCRVQQQKNGVCVPINNETHDVYEGE